MAIAYLGLGSNLGNRVQNLEKAAQELESHPIHIQKKSTVIETEPLGGPAQEKFLNAVLEISTTLKPTELLDTCHAVEEKLGRTRLIKNGPRVIDIDILLYEDKVINTKKITIPHPRMFERDFVMLPLKEIAPSLVEKLIHANH